ncbi:hypothetical protein FTUN_1681 [Frigoriglobus tundricola]|uniref:Exonuclease SbcC n=1 Tax=Frigoriglobus tundricola TaxID=2774151 RepID=A0A6M5YMK3_9BACT|nr:hypothetical protein FTUN_1681 [Frigoriglobus tundricola]
MAAEFSQRDLEGERACIERQLREAAARAAEGEQIRENHQRFEELERVLPSVSESLVLCARLVEHDADITRFSSELAAAMAARDSAAAAVADLRGRATACEGRAQNAGRETERLRERIDRDRRSLALADEVATLERKLRDIPTDLDVRLAAAEQSVREYGEQQRAAGERRSAAAGLLKAAEKRRRDFDSVTIGAECSRCGQPVSEEHARRERAELDDEVQCHRTERDATTHDETTATAALTAATTERDQLANVVRERNRVRDRFHDQRGVLAAQGICADAAVLRAEIEEHTRQAEGFDRAAADARGEKQEAEAAAAGQEATREQADARVATLTLRLTTATTRQATDAGRMDTLLDLLPSAWRDRVPAMTDADLHRELTDLDQLRTSDIRAQFLKLTEDATRRNEWGLRLTALDSAIEQVPTEARCSVPSAESLLKTTGERLASAKADHQSALGRNEQFRGHAERRRTLDEQHRALDLDCRLHDELADLLGAQRLQRDLVRTAEREIVRYANDTVRNLSRGDLTIELDDADDGPDRAFALRVRRAENPTPIGVVFLSGSQKFRVAVAVALAIGRFASRQARPLESVIIDEGFGSLDRDGLQAMGDELRNLQQCHSLRRLILVSHQEEFVARFPVGYRLEPGDGGTTAVRFRRECGAEV